MPPNPPRLQRREWVRGTGQARQAAGGAAAGSKGGASSVNRPTTRSDPGTGRMLPAFSSASANGNRVGYPGLCKPGRAQRAAVTAAARTSRRIGIVATVREPVIQPELDPAPDDVGPR